MRDDLRYRVGRFEIDRHTRELRLDSERIPLQPRVFDLLCYLAANPSRAISREELLGEVWADVAVSDAALSKAARVLRAILRRDPLTRDVFETVRGHGYRLRAPVEELDPTSGTAAQSRRSARPLVGREVELASMAKVVADVRGGKRRFVLVVGEPGSGKTALVQRFLETAAAGLLVGEGQCIQGFGEQSPYLPILEAFSNFARFDSASRRFRIRSIIQRAAPRWRAYLPALFPDESPADALFEMQPSEMARQILDAVELITREEPAILVLEDLQWADQSTLKLVQSICARSSPLPLLTICTVRTAEIDRNDSLRAIRAAVARSSGGHLIETAPVPRDGLREYALWSLRRDATDPGPSTDRFVDWLQARTDGHPLFFTQLIEHLSSTGLLTPSQGETFSTIRLDEAGIPANLGQLIRQWFGDLPAFDRDFLEAASVAGSHFDLRVVRSALDVDESAIEACCDRLCLAGWLRFRDFARWADGSRGARIGFAHVLFREALYTEIPPRRRAQLHLSIARRLEVGHPGESALASELASHFEIAGFPADAARHRMSAAAFAASTQSVDEALFHADRGLGLLPALPESERDAAEFGLQMSIAMALSSRSGFGELRAMAAFERARTMAVTIGDAAREVAATWGIATCLKMRGDTNLARETGERLLALAESVEEPRFLALALDLLCSIAFFQGRFPDCLELKRRMDGVDYGELREDPLGRSIEDVRVTTQLYGTLALWHLGDDATASEWVREAESRAERLGHPYTTVFVEVFAAILHSLLGDRDAQRRHAAHGHALGQRSGIAFFSAIARFMEIVADPPSSEGLLELRARLAEMAGFGGLGGTYFIQVLADHELAMGNLEVARKRCASGIAMAERTFQFHHLPILLVTAARLADDDSEREGLLAQADATAARIHSLALQTQVASARRALHGRQEDDGLRRPGSGP